MFRLGIHFQRNAQPVIVIFYSEYITYCQHQVGEPGYPIHLMSYHIHLHILLVVVLRAGTVLPRLGQLVHFTCKQIHPPCTSSERLYGATPANHGNHNGHVNLHSRDATTQYHRHYGVFFSQAMPRNRHGHDRVAFVSACIFIHCFSHYNTPRPFPPLLQRSLISLQESFVFSRCGVACLVPPRIVANPHLKSSSSRRKRRTSRPRSP